MKKTFVTDILISNSDEKLLSIARKIVELSVEQSLSYAEFQDTIALAQVLVNKRTIK